MKTLLILLTLLITSANAGDSQFWNLYFIDRIGGRHLQTYTDPQNAGKPIYFPSEDDCIGVGVSFMTVGTSDYVGFYCKEFRS
jgi:hypothetical protein